MAMVRAMGIGLVVGVLAGPAWAQTEPAAAAPSSAEMREMLDAAKATAKATRENLDYARVTPDLLYQILGKLDKLENKLDKIEDAIKRDTAARPRR
jgi:hypothetical protein